MSKHLVQFVVKEHNNMTSEQLVTLLEIVAAYPIGICYFDNHIETITKILIRILLKYNLDSGVAFKALSILLDISATENKIEPLARVLISYDMLTIELLKKFWYLFEQKITLKMLDLFVGLLLNLACNISDEEILFKFISMPYFVEYLLRVLIDSKKAWPVQGASLAFVQLAHMAARNSDFYTLLINDFDIEPVLHGFFSLGIEDETVMQQLNETLILFEIGKSKHKAISQFLHNRVTAAAA